MPTDTVSFFGGMFMGFIVALLVLSILTKRWEPTEVLAPVFHTCECGAFHLKADLMNPKIKEARK